MLKAKLFLLLPLLSAASPGADHTGWSTYGGGPDNTHYSALAQINRANVAQLQVAWRFDTHDEFPGSEIECNPIVVDGTLFATTPKLRIVALNADTGKLKWSFDPNKTNPVVGKMRNRGVAYWSDPSGKDKRIFFASKEYLYALDASSGRLLDQFGDNGRIDLSRDLGRDNSQLFITATSPPILYKDFLIVSTGISETLPALPGDIRAYDARSGKLRWSFHTIPHPGELGYDTWPKDAWKYIGGANNWAGMSLDVQRGIVFVPTGSATFDFYGANRLGDNLFANSLIALDAATGKRIWHFQTVRHDLWDRDLPAPPALVTVVRNGHRTDAAAQVTKSGFVFLFDRTNGKPLFPIEYRAYPPSDAPGERAATTQPLPTKPPPFARQALTEDMLTTRTPEAHEAVLQRFRKLRSAGQFIPPSLQGTVIFPGFDGGAEWGGPSFDPETGLLYVNANEMAWILRLVDRSSTTHANDGHGLYLKECASCHRPDKKGAPPEFPSLADVSTRLNEPQVEKMIRQGGGRMPSFARLPAADIHAIAQWVYTGENIRTSTAKEDDPRINQRYGIDGYNKFLDPDGYPAIQPPWGTLTAIDLNTGRFVWREPFGDYPELAAHGAKDTGSENYGGSVVTAGGLLFIAATSYDPKIHAYDKKTGQLLWEAELPAAGNATPAVYEIDGKEYVVIACGGGKSKAPSGGSYLAFALP